MCGIAGWLGNLKGGEHYADRVAHALSHRGPDGHGIKTWPEASLIHTRLSIIDLSPAGSQPMPNEDGKIWVICNGEIYNHRRIRAWLESRGHVFRGYSDSEILPHLYEEKGTAFVADLRGMFALALYDTVSRTLVLARDRFGIKPIFYAPGNERLAFASEIRPLLKLPGIDRRPDRQAVYDFSALFYIPAPETFYSGIRALSPGELLEARLDFDNVSWKIHTYNRWKIVCNPDLTLEKAADRADELIHTAVSRQLESDVPLASLLSGGIDSSLISAAAQASLNGSLLTFNERFPGKDYDETFAAVTVAKHIGSQHQTLDIEDISGTWDYITNLLVHTGQPFADTSLFAVSTICQLVRKYVKVVLSGDGGDEGFGGYNFYGWLGAILSWQSLPKPIHWGTSCGLDFLALLGAVPSRLGVRAHDLTNGDNTFVTQYLFSRIREEEHRQLCHDAGLLPLRRLFEPEWENHLPAKASDWKNCLRKQQKLMFGLAWPMISFQGGRSQHEGKFGSTCSIVG